MENPEEVSRYVKLMNFVGFFREKWQDIEQFTMISIKPTVARWNISLFVDCANEAAKHPATLDSLRDGDLVW